MKFFLSSSFLSLQEEPYVMEKKTEEILYGNDRYEGEGQGMRDEGQGTRDKG